MFKVFKFNRYFVSIFFLSVIGFFLRYKGLPGNYSFWTDEDHVALFARAILERGGPVLQNGYSTSAFQSLWYWITAFSMKIFGVNEFAARFPSVFFGVLTIIAIFFLGKKLFNEKVGIISSAFITFLTIEILWSRQARPYQGVQFLYIMEIYLFINILDLFDKKKRVIFPAFCLFLLIIFCSLMHWFGLMSIVFFPLYLVLIRRDILSHLWLKLKKFIFKNQIIGITSIFSCFVVLFFIFWKLGLPIAIKSFIFPAYGKIGFYNHFAYYHSFLWRQYGLLAFLALVGAAFALSRDFKKHSILFIVLIVFFGFINFRLRVPFSRYFFPVFFILVLWAANALTIISDSLVNALPKKIPHFLKNSVGYLLAMFIIFNGYKFTFKPKPFYSLNADMQEIPEVDFKKMYGFIKERTKEADSLVLVSTWTDHATWYMGEGKPEYWLRNPEVMYGEERDILSGAQVIGSVDKLKEVIKSHKEGMIILESWEPFIPDGSEEYIKKNLKKETEIDRLYPVQPRYWPVNVYSWGLK